MLFSDPIFLFVFLPIVLFGYYLIPIFNTKYTALRLSFLVCSSLFFYGWWYPPYLIILISSILFNYWILVVFQNTKKEFLCIFAVLVNLGLLFYFKYFNFFIENISNATGADFIVEPILLPLAISFFTFQQIAYVMDVKRGLISEYSFSQYCMFVTFFPQLIAGPIVHHSQIVPQFAGAFKKGASKRQIQEGLLLFFIGLFKKVCIADNLAPYANSTFDSAASAILTFSESILGITAYTLQIYFDFSGYSDMAIGLGLLFGLRLPDNFNSPYKSTNIIDFWRRWHITLSNFLRDYVYISMGGNRFGKLARYRNLYLTMVIGGIWHGASWNFVIWGALHGIYLIINHFWHHLISFGIFARIKMPAIVGWILTFTSVALAWVYFRADSVSTANAMLGALVVTDGLHLPQQISNLLPGSVIADLNFIKWDSIANFGEINGLIIILIGLLMLFFPNSNEICRIILDRLDRHNLIIPIGYAALIYISLSAVLFAKSTEFLYFNF
jgi:D-alanyl-lipoteichoic acid acyltransferase DltB (MBOAT superfamily)